MGDRVERLLEVHKAHIEWLLVLGLGLVVAAEYRSLVLTMSLISYVLNADSGR